MQGYSPRDLGLGLESTRDHFYAVLVLVLIIMVSVLVSVLKDWSRLFSRPVLYMSICFFVIFNRKKQQLRKSFAAYTCLVSELLLNFKRFHGHRLLRAAASVISISIRYDAFELSMASAVINCCIM